MIYPALLGCVGVGAIFVILDFVVPRFASIFDDGRMKIPLPTLIMLQASHIVRDWWWLAALVVISVIVGFRFLYRDARRTLLVGYEPAADSGYRRRHAQSRDIALRARHGDAGR